MESPFAMVADYVGVAGCVNGFGSLTGVPESATPYGPSVRNGTLHYHSKTRFADITDGSSHTLAVSECGAWVYTNATTKHDNRPSVQYGFAMGSAGNNDSTDISPNNSNGRVFNVTGLRYTVNPPPSSSFNMCSAGVCANVGNNTPLRSEHPGGVLALFGDGSVHFVADTTNATVLARLASRNDGFTVSLP